MTGAELITQERQRQIEKEGWTPEHDADMYHRGGELAAAAVCYAAPMLIFTANIGTQSYTFTDPWPRRWDNKWDKRLRNKVDNELIPNANLPLDERIRNLVKAGALIAAEIDRLQRLQAKG